MLKFKSIISKTQFNLGHSHPQHSQHHGPPSSKPLTLVVANKNYDHIFLNEKNGHGQRSLSLHNILLKYRK
jgi:hypothetical protein